MTAGNQSIPPETIDNTYVPRPAPHVAVVELDGEIVLYDDERKAIHRLSPTATLLWKCFDGAASLHEIAGDIADVYDVDRVQMLDDLVQTTRELGYLNLLDHVQAGPPNSASFDV